MKAKFADFQLDMTSSSRCGIGRLLKHERRVQAPHAVCVPSISANAHFVRNAWNPCPIPNTLGVDLAFPRRRDHPLILAPGVVGIFVFAVLFGKLSGRWQSSVIPQQTAQQINIFNIRSAKNVDNLFLADAADGVDVYCTALHDIKYLCRIAFVKQIIVCKGVFELHNWPLGEG